MIQIDYREVNGIPYAEVVDASLKDQVLPIVVFYHGWTGSKDRVVTIGVELAKRGMRAVLPDQHLHGDRGVRLIGGEIWEIVANNIKELPILKEEFRSRGLLDETKFGVSGLSMGGISTYALFNQYPDITAAASLMGNADPARFAKWTISSVWMTGATQEQCDALEAEIEKNKAFLDAMALAKHPEHINGRPLYLWHGTADDKVPYELNKEFYETIKDESYAENVEWHETPGQGHIVPHQVFEDVADFFQKVFQ